MAATRGDFININTVMSGYPTSSWRSTPSWTGSSRTVYFCAPSFVAQMHCETAWLFARIDITWVISYWGTGGWTQYKSDSTYAAGIGDSGTRRFCHNRDESANYSDISNNHWWRIVYSRSGDSAGSTGNTDKLSLWLGGIEMAYGSSATFLWQGKIYGCPVLYSSNDLDVTDVYYTYNKGTQISVDGGTDGWVFGRDE